MLYISNVITDLLFCLGPTDKIYIWYVIPAGIKPTGMILHNIPLSHIRHRLSQAGILGPANN